MTRFGEFLAKKSINRAAVARRIGISPARLSELSNKESARLTAEELYLTALAVGVDPGELLDYVCEGLELKQDEPGSDN